jgi:hypothetical protein
MNTCGYTPTIFYQERRPQAAYALPRKRERERTPLLSSLSRLGGWRARQSATGGGSHEL